MTRQQQWITKNGLKKMIDDIVTRLRQAYKNTDEVASVFLANEAADEIERLRAELQLAHSEIAIIATAEVEEEPF